MNLLSVTRDIGSTKYAMRVINGLLVLSLPFIFGSRSFAGDIVGNGLRSGKIIETRNKVIVEGATFVVNEKSNAPVIKLEKNDKRRIVLSNVRIISNNQTIADTTGNAGIVAIDNSKSKSKVTIRNLTVKARNSRISSVSMSDDVCAGLICVKQGKRDTATIGAISAGNTAISADQGERPDYRRSASR